MFLHTYLDVNLDFHSSNQIPSQHYHTRIAGSALFMLIYLFLEKVKFSPQIIIF